MPKYKDMVYVGSRFKRQISTMCIKNKLQYCLLPRCKVCGRILYNEYAIRYRRYSTKRLNIMCIKCYLKNHIGLPKKTVPKYEPYRTAYLQLMSVIR